MEWRMVMDGEEGGGGHFCLKSRCFLATSDIWMIFCFSSDLSQKKGEEPSSLLLTGEK
jgi:hypothetical protein